ncbi:sialate O-acetylesterase [Arundinibacter roseus]|uniref:Sialate O-acetylesterase n=2 Tax=Arundinibacter roseus TaxID=2070510 RepID=A0A4R4KHN9_9BACT|nr:sialate O-acetylesterase [Arundinibacter roseus]
MYQTGSSQIRLPRLVSDGMVLQRDTPVNVWGWAEASEKVQVLWQGKTYRTEADSQGEWKLQLPAQPAGGPYQMSFIASNQLIIKNILVGDVWVCSGQSNMALPMERVKERYGEEIAAAINPNIRHFFLPTRYNFQGPMQDLPPGRWESANPQSVMQFSAVAYFFAKHLYEKYQIPIGLINASVGGSPAEAWLSQESLKAFPEHVATAEILKDSLYIKRIQQREQSDIRAWYARLYKQDKGWQGEKSWTDPNFDASDWPVMQVPGFWEDAGVAPGNGVVWFRREIDIPKQWAKKPAKLFLGRIVDADSVFVNGRFIGSISYQYPPRRYQIPADLLKAGKNTLVIRVISTNGKGGFIPDKPYELVVDSKPMDLKGMWRYQVGATAPPLPGTTFFQYKPLGLFNGMIAPLVNYTIKGALWYQGESNADSPAEYSKLLSALIGDWRKHWQQTGAVSGVFPFIYVQLANYLPVQEKPSESNWAELRQAQLQSLSVPNTAMAVIIDAGEWNDIHPLNKQTVGTRLALAAEKVAYGDTEVVYSGPIAKTATKDGNRLVITFSHIGSGLLAKDGRPLKHFALAGPDKKYVWANARIEGNQVVVWSEKVPHPVSVRYAWADNPAGANLYNYEGLPASPFFLQAR